MDQTVEMWKRYKRQPRPELRDLIVQHYIKLAKLVVDRMAIPSQGHLCKEDLISHAIMGLIEAVERYNPEKGVKFETFAIPRIRGEVVDALRRTDWAPRSLRQKEREIRTAYERLGRIFGRAATDEEVADELGLSPETFQETLGEVATLSVISLEQRLDGDGSDDSSSELSDLIPDETDITERAEFEERKRFLAAALAELPERERLVVGLYYYEGLTLKEIGQVLGVTEARVSQMHAKSMMRLRGHLTSLEPVLMCK